MNASTTQALSLDQLLASTQDGVFALNAQRQFVVFNPACERLTGYAAAEVVGTRCRCSDVTECQDEHGRPLAGRLCPGLAVFGGETPAARQRMRIRTREGGHRWIETAYTPVYGGRGTPELIIGVMRDVSEGVEREQEWRSALKNLREEIERLRTHMRERYGFAGIISRSPRMQVVLEKIHAACTNASPVLIVGEEGTGKEMVARTIHFNGLQKDGPFVPENCSATPRDLLDRELFGYARGSFPGASQDFSGLYAAADGGTLYLSDIGALPPGAQVKLLRAVQDRAVRPLGSATETPANIRLIAASRRPVADLLGSQILREDLYYRLSVLTLELPPLRMRKEDIPFLVDHFLVQLNQEGTRQIQNVDPDVWAVLDEHDWPGNVRELQNVVETAFASGSGEVLTADDVAATIRQRAYLGQGKPAEQGAPLDETLADVERRTILAALRKANGQRSLAARLMGISRSRLYRRMDALGIPSRDRSP